MLPQRRKSAEEIAKLRESMGVPGGEPERGAPKTPPEAPSLFEAPAKEELPPPSPPKPVRSLRRSERESADRRTAPRPAGPGTPIPARKHNERELAALRMQTATPPDQSLQYIRRLAAPKPSVFAAYALSIAGALAGWLAKWMPGLTPGSFPADWMEDLSRHPATPQTGSVLMISACAAALAICGWIAWKKPRSRHHAGFAAILAVLVLAFGIIYRQDDGPRSQPAVRRAKITLDDAGKEGRRPGFLHVGACGRIG